jgi:hypothetical protein
MSMTRPCLPTDRRHKTTYSKETVPTAISHERVTLSASVARPHLTAKWHLDTQGCKDVRNSHDGDHLKNSNSRHHENQDIASSRTAHTYLSRVPKQPLQSCLATKAAHPTCEKKPKRRVYILCLGGPPIGPHPTGCWCTVEGAAEANLCVTRLGLRRVKDQDVRPLRALIDTGSSETLMCEWAARWLGFDLTGPKPEDLVFVGAGGAEIEPLVFISVEVKFPDRDQDTWFTLPCYVVPDILTSERSPDVLLGRKSVLIASLLHRA